MSFILLLFITAVPNTKRACVLYCSTVCVYLFTYYKAVRKAVSTDSFITAVPNTKLCAWGEEDSGGHVL
jgi:hypothetical protein